MARKSKYDPWNPSESHVEARDHWLANRGPEARRRRAADRTAAKDAKSKLNSVAKVNNVETKKRGMSMHGVSLRGGSVRFGAPSRR